MKLVKWNNDPVFPDLFTRFFDDGGSVIPPGNQFVDQPIAFATFSRIPRPRPSTFGTKRSWVQIPLPRQERESPCFAGCETGLLFWNTLKARFHKWNKTKESGYSSMGIKYSKIHYVLLEK